MTQQSLITMTIDDKEIQVPSSFTIFQACASENIEIPHFCYHKKLKIAGNCRMCLVEIAGQAKLAASCSMPVAAGMQINTHSINVVNARKGVMEFLLINHPLDCPVCDQGGECDLQDQAYAYGKEDSRFEHSKRTVTVKNMGPLISTWMNRCIHCLRCIRFADDIAGVSELCAVSRGEHTEITTYDNQPFSSELSGNIVDLCPVGALTSRPNAYQGRPWELCKTDSIDVMDGMGSNIRIDTDTKGIRRILPRQNQDINEDWISDKTRHAFDGLCYQRLDRPYIRKNGSLTECSWEVAIQYSAEKISAAHPSRVGFISGDLTDVETLTVAKDLCAKLNIQNLDCRNGAHFSTQSRAHYLFNTSISKIAEADFFLLVGAHPRYEAAVLNARIRQQVIGHNVPIYRIGSAPSNSRFESTYPLEDMGASPQILMEMLQGNHPICNGLLSVQKPMLILGTDPLTRRDGQAVFDASASIAQKYMLREDWNGFNILHQSAAIVGALDVGFTPNESGLSKASMTINGALDVLYLLGVDQVNFSDISQDTLIIYQGHHGDLGAQHADIILPTCAYTEKEATYVNTEGRVQHTNIAMVPPGQARCDWKVLVELSKALGHTFAYTSVLDVRNRMQEINPVFRQVNTIHSNPWVPITPTGINFMDQDLAPWKKSFYMSNVICNNSPTMAQCYQAFESSHLETKGL